MKQLIVLLAICAYQLGADSATAKSPTVEIVVDTTIGAFTVVLFPEKSPKTVDNFLDYVDEGFYHNTLFHRVVPGFVIQGGGFELEMKSKDTHSPIENESLNGLKNERGTIAMARKKNPNSATSQFFINVADNSNLDPRGSQFGYTVFGKVIEGMNVIDNIAAVPTHPPGKFGDVPRQDIVILSVQRKKPAAKNSLASGAAESRENTTYLPGKHYIVLDKPAPTRDSGKIEVVEIFSYGCPNCYSFDPLIEAWARQQTDDIDFWRSPAIWNGLMKLYAHAFYTAESLGISEKMHQQLFTAVVVEGRPLVSESLLGNFFAEYGVDNKVFSDAFDSFSILSKVKQANSRTRNYGISAVPELIINGKYRINPRLAGGHSEMLDIAEHLVSNERSMLKAR